MIALLRLSAGLVVWAAAFCLIYALHGVGCAGDWPARTAAGHSLHRIVLLAAWLGMTGISIAVALRLSRRRAAMLDRVSATTGWIGVAATVVTFVPIVLVPECL